MSNVQGRRRATLAVAVVIILGAFGFLLYGGIDKNVVFFLTPQELLSRQLFVELLDDLRADFDVVLFDTPPARLYADAQSVAFRAGSVLVLARKDHTRLADLQAVTQEMADAGVRTIGTVLNAG